MWPKDTKGNKTKGVLNYTLAGGGPLFARKAAPGCPKMLSVPAPIVGEAFMPPAGKCRISGNVVLMGESGFAKAKPRERRSTPLQLRFRPHCRGGIHASRHLGGKGNGIVWLLPRREANPL